MSYVDDMRRELELLVKHHRDVPLPPEEVPDFCDQRFQQRLSS